jgi:hypothetical protein
MRGLRGAVLGACVLGASAGGVLGQQAVRPAAGEEARKKDDAKEKQGQPKQGQPKEGEPKESKPAGSKPEGANEAGKADEGKGEASTRAGHALPAFPHPVISEVLFAVPSGEDGDMTGDGARSATGEEFVELVNPHDKPIELRGYRVVEGQVQTRRNESSEARQAESDRLDFTFPALELGPGEVVVIFSGFDTEIAGPVGTREASAEPNEHFANARVFSFGATSRFAALSNSNDMVQLIAPGGEGVQALAWDFRREASESAAGGPASGTKEGTAQGDGKSDGKAQDKSEGNTESNTEDKPDPGVVRSPAKGGGGAESDKSTSPREAKPSTTRRKPAPKRLPKHADVAMPHLQTITDASWREGSLQRDAKTGAFVPHLRLDGRLASPGEYAMHEE